MLFVLLIFFPRLSNVFWHILSAKWTNWLSSPSPSHAAGDRRFSTLKSMDFIIILLYRFAHAAPFVLFLKTHVICFSIYIILLGSIWENTWHNIPLPHIIILFLSLLSTISLLSAIISPFTLTFDSHTHSKRQNRKTNKRRKSGKCENAKSKSNNRQNRVINYSIFTCQAYRRR